MLIMQLTFFHRNILGKKKIIKERGKDQPNGVN